MGKNKYHTTLASYFSSRPHFFDVDLQKKPNVRKCVELPWHLIESNRTEDLKTLLLEIQFIEAKTISGFLHVLITEYRDAMKQASDSGKNDNEVLKIIHQSLTARFQFVRDNPEYVFQTLWNDAWGISKDISALFEKWQDEKESGNKSQIWLRSLIPSKKQPVEGFEKTYKTKKEEKIIFQPETGRLLFIDSESFRISDYATGQNILIRKGRAEVSPDGASIAFLEEQKEDLDIYSIQMNKTGTIKGNGHYNYYRLSWSPDSSYLALYTNVLKDFKVSDKDGNLIFESSDNREYRSITDMTWSPNEMDLVFRSKSVVFHLNLPTKIIKSYPLSHFHSNFKSKPFYDKVECRYLFTWIEDKPIAIIFSFDDKKVLLVDLADEKTIGSIDASEQIGYGRLKASSSQPLLAMIDGSPESDLQIKVYDIRNGSERAIFDVGDSFCANLTFSNNGDLLAYSIRSQIVVVSCLSGKRICTFNAHKYYIRQIVFTNDDQYIISRDENEITNIFKVEEHAETFESSAPVITETGEKNLRLSWSFSKNLVAIFEHQIFRASLEKYKKYQPKLYESLKKTHNYNVKIIDFFSGQTVAELSEHDAEIQAVIWTAFGKIIAWDVENYCHIYSMENYLKQESMVGYPVISPGGKHLIIAVDNHFTVRDVITNVQTCSVQLNKPITFISWSNNADYFGICCADSIFRLYKYSGHSAELISSTNTDHQPTSCYWANDNQRFAICSQDTVKQQYYLGVGSIESSTLNGTLHISDTSKVQWSADGLHIALLNLGTIKIYDSRDLTIDREITITRNYTNPLRHFQWLTGIRYFLIQYEDNFSIYDLMEDWEKHWTGHPIREKGLYFSPYYTNTKNGVVYFYHIMKSEPFAKLAVPEAFYELNYWGIDPEAGILVGDAGSEYSIYKMEGSLTKMEPWEEILESVFNEL